MNKTDLVSFVLPDSHDQIYFCAKLSNGENIYQDNREGSQHAFLRLKEFLKANDEIKIVGFTLYKQNGKTFTTPDDQKGYIFGYKKTKTFLAHGGEMNSICYGHYDGKICYMDWINLNGKIILSEQRTREGCGFFLIENS